MKIVRLLLATLLASLIMPTSSYLAGDPDAAVTPPVSAEAVNELETYVAEASTAYGIAAPQLRFVGSKVAGVTMPRVDGGTEIRLGTPLHRAAYRERAQLLQAVVGHEFGHAVMIARHDNIPAGAIFGMYALGLLPFLLVLRTARAIVAIVVVATVGLWLAISIPEGAIAHNTYQSFLVSLSTIALLAWGMDILRGRRAANQPGGHVATQPSRFSRSFALAGLVALPLFYGSSFLVGRMNSERELRADLFGACMTTPATMRDALIALTDKPVSSIKEALDTFHPAMQARIAQLDALERQPLVRQKACASLLGTKPSTLAAQTSM